MKAIIIFSVLLAAAWAHSSSVSRSVGSGLGTSFTTHGKGYITGVRLWEVYTAHIYGIQVRYGHAWSDVYGSKLGTALEIELFDDERIVQISGKFITYIMSIMIVTSRGRSIIAGQPAGYSFNMYPTNQDAGLRFLSGSHVGGLAGISAHWAVLGYQQ